MKISIVIPTYEMHGNGASFLLANFQKIKYQTHTDFDIIISDHSSDEEVKKLCDLWSHEFEIKYYKNIEDVGNSSANINNALKYATGDIVKILFQDDFLWNQDSLFEINNGFENNLEKHWLISPCEHSKDGETFYRTFIPKCDVESLSKGINTISSPSVLSFLNKDIVFFDENLIWMMDCDYYIMMHKKFGEPIILESVNVVNRIWEKQYNNLIPQSKKDEETEYMKNKLNKK